jgi:hypothetical protein
MIISISARAEEDDKVGHLIDQHLVVIILDWQHRRRRRLPACRVWLVRLAVRFHRSRFRLGFVRRRGASRAHLEHAEPIGQTLDVIEQVVVLKRSAWQSGSVLSEGGSSPLFGVSAASTSNGITVTCGRLRSARSISLATQSTSLHC